MPTLLFVAPLVTGAGFAFNLLTIRHAAALSATILRPCLFCLAVLFLSVNWETDVCQHKTRRSCIICMWLLITSLTYEQPLCDASHLQYGLIFGKVPNCPPNFQKVISRISRQNCDKSAYVHCGGTVVYYMILFPMSYACTTTVQHGNWLKK